MGAGAISRGSVPENSSCTLVAFLSPKGGSAAVHGGLGVLLMN